MKGPDEECFRLVHSVAQPFAPDQFHRRHQRLHRVLEQHPVRPKLLIIDEVGDLTLDSTQASHRFQVICQGYKNQQAIILTNNKAFADWSKVSPMTGQLSGWAAQHLGVVIGDFHRRPAEVLQREAGPFVSAGHHIEEQLGPGLRERDIAEFIEDEQIEPFELFVEPLERPVFAHLQQQGDQRRDGGEPHPLARRAGGEAPRRGQVGLARCRGLPTNSTFSLRSRCDRRLKAGRCRAIRAPWNNHSR
jgi:hypothetical protein